MHPFLRCGSLAPQALFSCVGDYITVLLDAHQTQAGTHNLDCLDVASLVGGTDERTIGVANDGLCDRASAGVPDLSANLDSSQGTSFQLGEPR
jgi:hypothetical protein